MDRPPTVSILFFLAAIGIIVAMFVAARDIPRAEEIVAETPTGEPQPETPPPPATRAGRIEQFADSWPAEPDFTPVFNALDPSFDVAATHASAFDPADEYFGLPRADGYERVFGYCSSCHSLRIVMQQHATRERWDELLDWMVASQGMAEPPAIDRTILLDYLSANFGAAE